MTTEQTVELAFSGPFAWFPGGDVPCLSDAPEGHQAGIYLWTAPTPSGELVYYVGETGRSFARRMQEHLSEQLSGRYRLYEPKSFLRGERNLLWRGLYGSGAEPSLLGFVERLPTLAPPLAEFVRAMRFHVAPTTCGDRLRRRIEAAIALHLYGQANPIGELQDAGIHYAPRLPEEEAVVVHLEWAQRPLGVPDALEA